MKRLDLTGIVFGKLTVLEYSHINNNGKTMWICKCECGRIRPMEGAYLNSGGVKSCGCRVSAMNGKVMYSSRHKQTNSRMYKIYHGMKSRCTKKGHVGFPEYGGRGISICDSWLESYDNFYDDMKDGYSDNLSLDRINVNGNYEPSNCRWATIIQQRRNTRSNLILRIGETEKCLSEWASIYGVPKATIRSRIKLGWNTEDAIKKPVENSMRNISKYLVH